MSVITVRIPDELDPLMDEFCKIEDRSKSWLVRKALEEKLKKWLDTKVNLGQTSQKTSRTKKKKK